MMDSLARLRSAENMALDLAELRGVGNDTCIFLPAVTVQVPNSSLEQGIWVLSELMVSSRLGLFVPEEFRFPETAGIYMAVLDVMAPRGMELRIFVDALAAVGGTRFMHYDPDTHVWAFHLDPLTMASNSAWGWRG